MVLLQPKLSLRVSQKQILTPGLVQMVSVLALNKLELTDMITAELTENPVLEELEDSVPLLDDVSAREEKMDRDSSAAALEEPPKTAEEKDPFEEIDFGTLLLATISIPACARRSRWKTARSRRSRTSSPSPPL